MDFGDFGDCGGVWGGLGGFGGWVVGIVPVDSLSLCSRPNSAASQLVLGSCLAVCATALVIIVIAWSQVLSPLRSWESRNSKVQK